MTWREYAACANEDTNLFFSPGDGDMPGSDDYNPQVVWVAKSICGTCDVRHACLEYALENEPTHGVYGGLTPKERRKIILRRAREAAEREKERSNKQ